MAAIFDFSLICTSDSLWGSLVVSTDLENMGIAVGISLLSCIEIELRLISFLQPPSWISDFRFSSDSVSDDAVEKFTPENIGVDTGIVFLSRRIAELLGGGNFTTLPRGPRYQIRSAVRGLLLMLMHQVHMRPTVTVGRAMYI